MTPIVLVVLLNGVQINMPAPGLLIDGRAWVPLRALAQRLGWSVIAGSPRLILARGQTKLTPPETRLFSGHTYVPARWLEKLGVAIAYNPVDRTLSLFATLPASSDRPPTISDIARHPADWHGRAVELIGEFMGFAANPLWDCLRFGPPVTSGDWVLRSYGGAIYCVGPRPFDFPAQLGRRCRVSGRVELTERGWPYIRVGSVEPLTGRDAICCCILTARYRYKPTDEIKLRLLVRNDGSEPLKLTFPSSQIYDFRLLDADGEVVWQWSHGRMFLMAISHRTFEPGEQKTFEAVLRPSDINGGLKPGIYFAEGELYKNARSYREKILVVEDK